MKLRLITFMTALLALAVVGAVAFAMTLAVGGAVGGAITGGVLVWLLRQPRPEA